VLIYLFPVDRYNYYLSCNLSNTSSCICYAICIKIDVFLFVSSISLLFCRFEQCDVCGSVIRRAAAAKSSQLVQEQQTSKTRCRLTAFFSGNYISTFIRMTNNPSKEKERQKSLIPTKRRRRKRIWRTILCVPNQFNMFDSIQYIDGITANVLFLGRGGEKLVQGRRWYGWIGRCRFRIAYTWCFIKGAFFLFFITQSIDDQFAGFFYQR